MRSGVAGGQASHGPRPPNLVTAFSQEQRVAAFEGYSTRVLTGSCCRPVSAFWCGAPLILVSFRS